MLALALGSLASASGPTSSRLPLSRIADANAPSQQLQQPSDVLADCVPESIKCLRGGASGTKCDVVLVGCGVPKRGMGWYHAKQMLDGDVPSAKLTAVVEPWFLGAGADSPPGQTFKEWADQMEGEHGTKFVKDISELEIKVCMPARALRIFLLAPRAHHTCPRAHAARPRWCRPGVPAVLAGRRVKYGGLCSPSGRLASATATASQAGRLAAR